MTKVTYDTQLTALLVIDPYNDFISEGGKVWDRLLIFEPMNGSPHNAKRACRKKDLSRSCR